MNPRPSMSHQQNQELVSELVPCLFIHPSFYASIHLTSIFWTQSTTSLGYYTFYVKAEIWQWPSCWQIQLHSKLQGCLVGQCIICWFSSCFINYPPCSLRCVSLKSGTQMSVSSWALILPSSFHYLHPQPQVCLSSLLDGNASQRWLSDSISDPKLTSVL